MKGRKLFSSFLLLLVVGVGITTAEDGKKYLPSEKTFYLEEAELAFIRPGLQLKIQSVEVNAPSVSVTFRIADDKGQGLDMLGIQTPGEVSTTFILARIKPGESQYTSYVARTQTSPITGDSALQASSDSGGSYTSLGDGVYTYTLGTQLPSDFEADATHTVGIYSRRDLTEFEFDRNAFVANALFDFVPFGGEVTQVREVVSTGACNQCHNPLGEHGGVRLETGLCILCHQPQSTDPDTGNTVDFKVMIHKIHRGAELPSVEDGIPYQIIGFRQSVHDYSTVEFPQDVRYCTTCHQQGSQADNWKTNPTRAACGSCHDNVNFATGEHHIGGIQTDDSLCSICHTADTGFEFDLSVAGVHTIPEVSKQLAGVEVEILDVTGTNPGDNPTVAFNVTDGEGNPVDISTLDRVRFTLAGPTSDYTFRVGPETATSAAIAGPSGYSYTFSAALPADATGTYAIAAEARQVVTLAGPLLGQSFPGIRDQAFNPVFYFGVGGSEAVPRRKVVDVNSKCNVCHERLSLHGGSRQNTDYCIMCHNPQGTDIARRPEDQLPPQTIDFRTLIHRIHSGEELTNDFTVYGFGNRPHFFNEVRFPGDTRDCASCHVGSSYQLPLADNLASVDTPRHFFTPTPPASAACLGCHDDRASAAHAFVMIAPFGESCAACHGEGRDFAVSKVHAR